MTAVLTQTEIDERVAILRHLRSLLEKQRQKFRDYLQLLERQEQVITAEDTDTLMSQTELEQQIVSGISTLQRVIAPVEQLYRESGTAANDELPQLQTDLAELQSRVLAQNEKNRSLLKTHMTSIRSKIAGIKNPYANRQSIYSTSTHSASIIDVTT